MLSMMRKLAMNKLNKFINNISALAVNASYFIFICRKEGWGRPGLLPTLLATHFHPTS